MHHIGWDNGKKSRFQYLRITVNRHFKFTFNGKRALLMNVFMQWHRTARFDLDKINRIAIGVDQFGEKAGCYLFGSDIGKVSENGGVHVV